MIRIIFGLLNIAYFVFLYTRGIAFSKFFLLSGLFFTVWGFVSKRRGYDFSVRYPKISIAINILLIAALASFLILESFIIMEGTKKDLVKTDYVVVLGAGLWGETPSDTLYKRLDAALAYINKNPEIKIVLSGGKGPGENITEAEAMKRYLVSKGISEKNIYKEEKSTSTEENLRYTKELINNISKKDKTSLTVVTSNFHMLRAKLLAEKGGFETFEYSSPILSWLMPVCYVREYFAMIKYFVFR